MRAFFLFVFLTSFTTISLAQNQPLLDSLKYQLSKSKGEQKVEILNKLGEVYQQLDLNQSQQYLDESQKLAIKINDKKGLFGSYFESGYNSFRNGDLQKALSYFNRAKKIAKDIKDDFLISRILNAQGSVYKTQSKYKEALDVFFEALKVAEKLDNKVMQGNLLGNVGLVFFEYNDLHQALKYYNNSYKIAEEIGDKRLLGTQSNNIALVYNLQKDYEKSLEYHHKSLIYKREMGNIPGIAYSLTNIGKTLLTQGKLSEAEEYLKQSLQVNNVLDKDLLSISYLNLGEVYLKQKKYNEALKAEEKSLQLATEVESTIGQKEALGIMHKAYAGLGQYQKAYTLQDQYLAKNDTIFNEDKNEQLTKIRELYESEKKEKELVLKQQKINLLERDNRISFLWRNFFLTAFILAGIIGFLIYRFLKLKEEKNKELFKTQQALTLAELENTRLKSEELQKELHFINKELTTYALNMVQKNEIMEELKKNIDDIKKDSEQTVSKKLNNLNKLVDYSFNLDKDWEDFKLYFEKIHDNFFKTLKEKCPDITPNELKLCALLKLNMNLKESSTILGISSESVKTARYRLRKKLNLSREMNLVDYIMGIEA